jgi:hypothetical protein
MFFFMKPSTLNVDCFTFRPDVYEYFPITKSTEYYPEWWKKLSKDSSKMIDTSKLTSDHVAYPHPTMKTCTGLTDFFANGLTIPLWSDFYLQINDDGGINWKFADQQSSLTVHRLNQVAPGFTDNKWLAVLVGSPWLIKAKAKFCYMEDTWNNVDKFCDIKIAPGILDFNWMPYTNAQILFRNISNKKYLLNANTPLINLVPMSEKRMKIHNHLVSQEEWTKLAKSTIGLNFFINSGKKLQKIKKNRQKCPFLH